MAFVTAAEVRELSLRLTSVTEHDAILTTLITRCERAIAKFCGYPATMEVTSYTDYLGDPDDFGVADWDDYEIDRTRCCTRYGPIVAVTSCWEDAGWDWDNGTEVDPDDLVQLGPRELGRKDGGRFIYRPRATRLIYTAGYATDADEVDDLKAAIIEWVLYVFNLRGDRRGKSGTSQQSLNVSFRPETMPASVRQLVQPFRLPHSLVA